MFRFKQFTIRQEQSPMKVGTDGVLLGAWARLRPDDRRLLDIGTATGVIALMLAQRAPEASVTGIDILSVEEARANADASPWGERIRLEQTPVQAFTADAPFDHILSNPPFFADSLTCPDAGRTTVRHGVTLTYEELCRAAARLLAPEGRFSVVIPTTELARWERACTGILRLTRRTDVRTTPRRAPKRVLLEMSRTDAVETAVEHTELVIGTGEHETYTPEYRALTGEFYLKF